MNNLLNEALFYWQKNWSIVPTDSVNKRPLIKWREYQTKRATREQIEQWFGDDSKATGIQVVTGKISGIVVVDIDIPDTTHFDKFSNVVVRSGGNKTHLYFKYPDFGFIGLAHFDQPFNGTTAHIDILGSGGVAVLPPSLHKSGNTYQWVKGRDVPLSEYFDIPSEILKLMVSSKDKGVKPSLDHREIEEVTHGNRNSWLKDRAFYLACHGINYEYLQLCVMAINTQFDEPLPTQEVIALINAAYRNRVLTTRQ